MQILREVLEEDETHFEKTETIAPMHFSKCNRIFKRRSGLIQVDSKSMIIRYCFA